MLADIKWKTLPQKNWSKHLIAVLRGLAVAAPILLIFGGLFVAADAVFQGIIERTFHFNGETLFTHVALISVFSWAVAGYLRGSLFEPFGLENAAVKTEIKPQTLSITEIKEDGKEAKTDENRINEENRAKEKNRDWRNFDNSILPKFFTLGAVEISIVLGLINLLFLGFVIVQIPYLFGGMDLVQNTPDFKLAEYARRGFGELVTVAALVLPILLVSHWLLQKDSPVNEKIYRVLAGFNIALLFVIMISATQRLLLLTGNLGYGLTTIRLYPMVFMIWLALVFLWFSLTILRGAREQFAWGALWSAFFVVGTLHIFNPDDFIVRTNIRLLQEGRSFDASYNSSLSDDALPYLMENSPAFDFQQRKIVRYNLARRFCEKQSEKDFRSWNLSRWIADESVSEVDKKFFIDYSGGCGQFKRKRPPRLLNFLPFTLHFS